MKTISNIYINDNEYYLTSSEIILKNDFFKLVEIVVNGKYKYSLYNLKLNKLINTNDIKDDNIRLFNSLTNKIM